MADVHDDAWMAGYRAGWKDGWDEGTRSVEVALRGLAPRPRARVIRIDCVKKTSPLTGEDLLRQAK